jgi:preprotein translocase subunit SecB
VIGSLCPARAGEIDVRGISVLAGRYCESGGIVAIVAPGRRVEDSMADEVTGNGQPPEQPAGMPQGQQLIINAQYIKDLSFENPRAPQSLMQQATPPSVEINIDVKAQSIGPDSYEVVLTLNAAAKVQNDTLFLVELTYGAIATVRNVPQQMMPHVVLVETPRLMFPFARNIIAETTRDGGFPPLMINPVDFAELLRRNTAAAGAESIPSADTV